MDTSLLSQANEQTQSQETTNTTTQDSWTAPEWAKGLSVDQEILKAPMFQSIKSVDDIVKGYHHAQKMVGADKVIVPNKNSSAEEWRNYFVKAGLPEKFDDYKPEIPQSFDNEQFRKTLTTKAYELNIKPDQLSEITKLFDGYNNDIVKEYEADVVNEIKATESALRKEWGEGFEKQIHRANRVVKHFGGEELHKDITNSELANNGQFLRLMAKIGEKMLNEDSFKPGTTTTFGMTKEEAKSKINAIYGDLNSPYYNKDHAQHKEYLDNMLKYQEILAN